MDYQDLTGQTLGQYELRELLGVGGMGAVYRAYQANLKRYVAMKVISSELAEQPGYLERFTREAETSAALEHPNIIHILDYGMQGRISYLIMQLLTGGTLAERIAQRRDTANPLPSMSEIADLLKQIGSALDYAHSQDVIHRDIKPSNVMFDNHGNAYLVDFGIAKLAAATQAFTDTGTIIGTLGYMAPEQWRADDLTPATDQYALSVMTYALVTGQMPFDAVTPANMMHQHLHEMPEPPQTHRSDVPEALTYVVERALAKRATDRFPTCTAFAQAFDSAIRGDTGEMTNYFKTPLRRKPPRTPVPTPSDIIHAKTFVPSSERAIHRHPLVWIMVVLLLIMTGVIGFMVLSDNEPATEPAEVAVATSLATATELPVETTLSPGAMTKPSTTTLTNTPTTTAMLTDAEKEATIQAQTAETAVMLTIESLYRTPTSTEDLAATARVRLEQTQEAQDTAGGTLLLSENFDSEPLMDWGLKAKWDVVEYEDNLVLHGKSHSWALLPQRTIGRDFRLDIRLMIVSGAVHIVVRNNNIGRHYVGLMEDGTYLTKEYYATERHIQAVSDSVGLRHDVWHDVSIIFEGDTIELWVNLEKMWEYSYQDPFLSGTFAFETLTGGEVYIDDLVIYER